MSTTHYRLAFSLAALLCASPGQAAEAPAQKPAVPPVAVAAAPWLQALPGVEAPVLKSKTTLRMKTTAGDVMIEVYPEAAPNAAARFIELAKNGFYKDTPVSRVVPGFVAQFGINWRKQYKPWEDKHFKDDPSLFQLERGTLAFAKSGPDTNATQVFINYTENNRLTVRSYNFTAFGKVVSGMEVVDKFAEVGEPGMGLDQDELWNNGEAYLKALPIKPTMILALELVK